MDLQWMAWTRGRRRFFFCGDRGAFWCSSPFLPFRYPETPRTWAFLRIGTTRADGSSSRSWVRAFINAGLGWP